MLRQKNEKIISIDGLSIGEPKSNGSRPVSNVKTETAQSDNKTTRLIHLSKFNFNSDTIFLIVMFHCTNNYLQL